MRQSCDVRQGDSEHVHAADPRHPVHLQFYPDGYEWAEEEPVLVSRGNSDSQVLTLPLAHQFFFVWCFFLCKGRICKHRTAARL